LTNKKKQKKLPKIALDGANIACAFMGHQIPGDATGIVKAHHYFVEQGHEVVAFVKQFRMNEKNPKQMMKNLESFHKEVPKDAIAVVPARADDDSFFIDFCVKNSAVLITQDGLKDHEERLQGEDRDNFLKWRSKNRCDYMFALDQFMPDPNFSMPEVVGSGSSSSGTSSSSSDSAQSANKKERKPNAKKKSRNKTNPKKKGQQSRSNKHGIDDLEKVLRANMESEFRVHSMGTDLVGWCNEEWGTSMTTIRALRKYVGLPTSPSMSSILERLFGDEVSFSGEGQNLICKYQPAAKSKTNIEEWLVDQMGGWIRLSGLGHQLSSEAGGKKPKMILKELGSNGKTFEELLKNHFGHENLEFRGESNTMEVRLVKGANIPIPSPVKKVDSPQVDQEAVKQILQILGLPADWKPPNLMTFFKRLIGKNPPAFESSMNYARVGEEFLRLTGDRLSVKFPDRKELLNNINESRNGLSATFANNTLTIKSR